MSQVARTLVDGELPLDPETEAAELRARMILRGRDSALLTRTPAQREAVRRLAQAEEAETVGRVRETRRR